MAKKKQKSDYNNDDDFDAFESSTGQVRFILDSVEDILTSKPGEAVNSSPCSDVFVSKDNIVVHVELPGVLKKDINLSILENRIIVKAVKYDQTTDKNLHYICMERSFGRLQRSIEIPYPIHSGKISAEHKNGVLIVTLPRVPEKRGQVKKIDIIGVGE